jgi:hypothetical protein
MTMARRMMDKRLTVALGVALAICLGAGGSAWAQSKTGSTVGGFLQIEPNARAAALGNAGSALPGGVDAVYYNTGVIGLLEQTEVVYSHSFWFADIAFDYVAWGQPVGDLGNAFVSFTALNSGEMAVRTVDQPLGTGENFSVNDFALGLGFGRRITSRFAVGLQFNYATETIWHTSARMITFNVGTSYLLTDGGARLGFCLSNIGPRARFTDGDLAIRYDADPDIFGDNSSLPGAQMSDEFPLANLFRFGLSVPHELGEATDLLFLIEALHPNDNSESANLGVEMTWNDVLALRAGYQALFQTDRQLGLTLGFGVSGSLAQKQFRFDYAWAGHDYLDDTHRLSILLNF